MVLSTEFYFHEIRVAREDEPELITPYVIILVGDDVTRCIAHFQDPLACLDSIILLQDIMHQTGCIDYDTIDMWRTEHPARFTYDMPLDDDFIV
jgi:hypothetical protein